MSSGQSEIFGGLHVVGESKMKDFYKLQPFHVYGPIYTDIETIAKRFIFKNLKGKDSDLKLKYIYFG